MNKVSHLTYTYCGTHLQTLRLPTDSAAANVLNCHKVVALTIPPCSVKRCKSSANWVRTTLGDSNLHSHLCTEHWKMLCRSDWTAAVRYQLIPMEIDSKQEFIVRLREKRVVICEDDAVTSLQLSRGLRNHGLDILGLMLNGLETVDLVQRARPDIALMDINVPCLDGLSAAERILSQGNRVCIVMATAYSDEESIQRAAKMGVMGWIVKPITTAEMIARLGMAWAVFENKSQAAASETSPSFLQCQ